MDSHSSKSLHMTYYNLHDEIYQYAFSQKSFSCIKAVLKSKFCHIKE